MTHPKSIKKVVIVGRKNTGKSTLMNALLKRKRVLSFEMEGTTRDAIEELLEWNGKGFLLVDTGGLTPTFNEKKSSEFWENKIISKIVEKYLKEADLVLFVVDGLTGPTGADEEVAQFIREKLGEESQKKVLLIVNKTEKKSTEAAITDFYSLGFPRIIPVSSKYGKGIPALRDMLLEKYGTPIETQPEDVLKWAFFGRPNVGKSSLLNAIAGEEKAIVSEVPGTTRDVIYYEFQKENSIHRIYDTPGLRKHSRVKEHIEKIMGEKAIDLLEKLVEAGVLVVDATEGLTHQDKTIASLIHRKKKAVVVALNKSDILRNRHVIKEVANSVKRGLAFLGRVKVVPTSAITKEGIDHLIREVEDTILAYRTRVKTSALNALIEETVRRHEGSLLPAKTKLLYATQVETSPPLIVMFFNKKEDIPASFLRYLRNRIQDFFGMEGGPIEFKLKEREETRKKTTSSFRKKR